MDKQKDNFTNWTHTSYEKIPESPNNWKLTESDFRAFKKTAWVVTEKIHGANFCIVTDGSEVRFAKRKEFLQPDKDFFGHQSLQIKLAQQVKDIFQIIQAERPQTFIVSVYGELFGGEYPHPDVAAVPNVQAVQTGIYYSPKIEFCAFDIAVEENSKTAKRDYIDYDKALKIFQQVEILGAKPLFIGKYEQAVAQNIEFDSTIPALLGLPKLPFSNKAEGIVIKPVKSTYIVTPKGRIRPVLKKKIPKFAEESRFHQAEKWTSQKSATATNSFSDERWLKEVMLALVTENRLINTMSKVGRISGKDPKTLEKVFQLFVNDVLEAFNESYESILKTLPERSQQTLIEQVEQESKKLMNNYFKQ
ncbi:RNA ligase [Cyanobacteria bacterium FACHB-472]|nr:RNA ligase [Cyanobacteria bacterium FACHB-472]